MRRPIIPICGGLTGGIAAAKILEAPEFAAAFAIAMAGCLLLHKNNILSKKTALLLIITAILGSALCIYQDAKLERQALEMCREEVIEGRVVSAEKRRGEGVNLEIATKTGKVKVSVYEDIEYRDLEGRGVIIEGTPEIPKGRTNPNCFDYKENLKSNGICCIMSAKPKDLQVGATERPAVNFLSKIRGGFSRKMAEEIGEESTALLTGLLFGEKNEISEETYNEFQKTGIVHILAVSGTHIGIVYVFAEKIFGRRRTLANGILKAVFVLVYAALAGFAPSVTRAAIMILLHIISQILNMRYDMLSSACVTAIIMLVINPLSLFNSGFQMSFIAITSLAVIAHRLKEVYDGLLLPALCVQIGMMPHIAYTFNFISVVGILANIPIILLGGLIIPVGIIALIISVLTTLPDTSIVSAAEYLTVLSAASATSAIPTEASVSTLSSIPTTFAMSTASSISEISEISEDGGILNFAFEFAAFLLDHLIDLLTKCGEIAYAGGRTFFYCRSPEVWQLVLYYGILYVVMSESFFIWTKRGKKKVMLAAFAALITVSVTVGFALGSPFERAQMVFVDVGQGDCLHIRTEDGKNILIDGGGSAYSDVSEKILMPYLLKNGVKKVDLAVITHMHLDHYGGIAGLSEYVEIGKIALFEGYKSEEEDLRKMLPGYKGEFQYLKKGDTIKLSEKAKAEVLYPPAPNGAGRFQIDEKDENGASLIIRVDYDGVSALMTADISNKGEERLLSDIRNDSKQGEEKFGNTVNIGRQEDDNPVNAVNSIRQEVSNTGNTVNIGRQEYSDNSLRADILKVPHHGSKYSSSDAFIRAVSPNIAVIQVGKNYFGHPAESVIEKYQKSGIMVYRQDWCGAVCMYDVADGEYKVITVNGGERSRRGN